MIKLLPLLLLCTNSFAMSKLHYNDIICVNDDFYGKMECKITEKNGNTEYISDCYILRGEDKVERRFNVVINKKTKFTIGNCK